MLIHVMKNGRGPGGIDEAMQMIPTGYTISRMENFAPYWSRHVNDMPFEAHLVR